MPTAFQFTPVQITELQRLRTEAQVRNLAQGAWAPVYDYLYAQLAGYSGADRDEECKAPQKDCRVIGYDEIFLGSVSTRSVYIRCARADIVRDGGCFARTTFRSRRLKYTFQRSKLPQWREIDAKTRQLLAEFVINETVLR